MNSLTGSSAESLDGFSFTFEDSLSYTNTCSADSDPSDLEDESVSGKIRVTSKLWRIGTLWAHEIS